MRQYYKIEYTILVSIKEQSSKVKVVEKWLIGKTSATRFVQKGHCCGFLVTHHTVATL